MSPAEIEADLTCQLTVFPPEIFDLADSLEVLKSFEKLEVLAFGRLLGELLDRCQSPERSELPPFAEVLDGALTLVGE